MNQHLLVKIRQLCVACRDAAIALGLAKIGALIWTVRRSGIFPTQLNDSELIRGSLGITRRLTTTIAVSHAPPCICFVTCDSESINITLQGQSALVSRHAIDYFYTALQAIRMHVNIKRLKS
jgi:hypothetical protein